MKYNSVALFYIKLYILCTKGTSQSANLLEFLVYGSKFTKFLSFLTQKIGFSLNFAPLFSIMRHNSSVLFSWSFIYFQQKDPIKVQIWRNFVWALESLKFCTLVGFLCKNHIQFQLKKYRRFISHDTEEWCKI